MAAPPPTVTLEQAQAFADKVTLIMAADDTKAELATKKAAAGGDLMKLMMTVIPFVITKIGDDVAALGFPKDQMGMMMLMGAMKAHKGDPKVDGVTATIMAAIK